MNQMQGTSADPQLPMFWHKSTGNGCRIVSDDVLHTETFDPQWQEDQTLHAEIRNQKNITSMQNSQKSQKQWKPSINQNQKTFPTEWSGWNLYDPTPQGRPAQNISGKAIRPLYGTMSSNLRFQTSRFDTVDGNPDFFHQPYDQKKRSQPWNKSETHIQETDPWPKNRNASHFNARHVAEEFFHPQITHHEKKTESLGQSHRSTTILVSIYYLSNYRRQSIIYLLSIYYLS